MNIHRLLLFITITLWCMSVYSEDCMVTTQARSLMTDSTLFQEEQLNEAEGRYSAVLKNNDVILAQYASCNLGMQAHYLSVNPLTDAELKQLLEMFLTRVLSSDMDVKKVVPQLKGLTSTAFQKPVILQGINDQHQLVVKPAASPNFHTIVQYNWLPPEY